MTWAQTIATGSGEIRFRISIEGWPDEWVTHKDMKANAADGRVRRHGLRSDGFKIVERVDLVRAKLEADGLRVKIADIGGFATASFAKRPQAVTYLTSSLDTSTTTVDVLSTTGFALGYVHIGRETISYDTASGTAFSGGARGRWDTLAAGHYITGSEQHAVPEVTDHPVVLEGRRVRLYAYGTGDSPTGNGTLVWMGVASTDPSFDGTTWSFRVDPITRVLEGALGSDLEDPSPLRGIYYPFTAPLLISIFENSTDGATVGVWSKSVSLGVAGFWESNAEFITDLTDYIATAMASPDLGTFSQKVKAIEHDGQWAIRVDTTASPKIVRVTATSPFEAISGHSYKLGATTGRANVYAANSSYVFPLNAASEGTVPRGAIGGYAASYREVLASAALGNRFGMSETTAPRYRLHLGGVAAVTTNTNFVQVDWESTGYLADEAGHAPFRGIITARSVAQRYLDIGKPDTIQSSTGIAWYAFTAAKVPTVRMGRNYGVGSLATFITELTGNTAVYVNTGAVPDIRTTDIEVGEIAAAADYSPLTSKRTFNAFAEVTVGDLIEQEARLLGVYPCLTAAGKITFKRLRLPSPSEAASHAITSNTIVVDDQFFSYEKSALGIFNTVLFRSGYNAIEDTHKGAVYKVRDVAAYGQAPNARVLEIAPLSQDPSDPIVMADVVRVASRVLGVFGGAYAYVTLEVPLTLFGVLIGDAVSITWSKLPESDGTTGVTEKIGLVVGREWEFRKARGTLTILVTDQRIAGYAPGGKITSIGGTSGTTGPFSINVSADYQPSGKTLADFMEAGDKIRLVRWASTTTSGNVTASITSITGNAITFTADSAWTHAAGTWLVGAQVSTSISADGQKVYAYIARSDGLVDWDSDADNPGFTLAP